MPSADYDKYTMETSPGLFGSECRWPRRNWEELEIKVKELFMLVSIVQCMLYPTYLR